MHPSAVQVPGAQYLVGAGMLKTLGYSWLAGQQSRRVLDSCRCASVGRLVENVPDDLEVLAAELPLLRVLGGGA